MIDEEATFREYGYRSSELGRWSKNPIIVICEKCNQPRTCRNDSYRDLCMSCVQKGNTNKKGKIVSDEGRCNMSRAGFLRPPMSDQTKELVVTALTGRPVSEETRCKIAESETGKTVSEQTRCKSAESHTGLPQSDETRRRRSATRQGIPYDDWESYATNSLYCPKFNELCRESNREKYGRHCFLTGAPESANVNKSGKMSKLSVHHVDMDKMQGCIGNRWKLVPLLMGIHTKMHSEVWMARIEYLIEHVWYPAGVWTPDALC